MSGYITNQENPTGFFSFSPAEHLYSLSFRSGYNPVLSSAFSAMYSTSWNVLQKHFISHLSCCGPLSHYPSYSLTITLTSLSPSVKQASGSSDSSGSSSTESTPSPGGRISTVLPSDELRGWGSASSFCMNEEEEKSTKSHCSAWNHRGSVVIGANLLSWLLLWFSSHIYSATTVYLNIGTVIAHRVGLSSSCYHHHLMQHRSNVPTGFDISFIWWVKSDYVAKHGRGEVGVTEMHCGYVWRDLSSRKSACSIPVHYQSKPDIVPSRTCAQVFSCPLKNGPKSIFWKIPKCPKLLLSIFPHLKSTIHPQQHWWIVSSVTWKHIISIP